MKYRIRKEINWYSETVKYYLEKYEKLFIFFGGYVWKNAKKYWDICPPYTDDYFDTEDQAKLYLKQLTKNSREKIVLETNLSSKKCDNCGEYIEMSEFEKNPDTVYCRHCRMTQFDGPDIYD